MKQEANLKTPNIGIQHKVAVLEKYLREYCKVHSMDETGLKSVLQVWHLPQENMICVSEIGDRRRIKIGLRSRPGSTSTEVVGDFTYEKDKFPETVELLDSICNKR